MIIVSFYTRPITLTVRFRLSLHFLRGGVQQLSGKVLIYKAHILDNILVLLVLFFLPTDNDIREDLIPIVRAGDRVA